MPLWRYSSTSTATQVQLARSILATYDGVSSAMLLMCIMCAAAGVAGLGARTSETRQAGHDLLDGNWAGACSLDGYWQAPSASSG